MTRRRNSTGALVGASTPVSSPYRGGEIGAQMQFKSHFLSPRNPVLLKGAGRGVDQPNSFEPQAEAAGVSKMSGTPDQAAPKRWITIKEASHRFSVSPDWLYRNKRIVKSHLGRRMVRVDLEALEDYFRNHEV